jgi:hypothetical protein
LSGSYCTIKIYAISSSSGTDRTVSISDGTATLTEITGLGAAEANTYAYAGAASDIYVGCNSSGVNIYGIRITY